MWDINDARDYDFVNTAVLFYQDAQEGTVNEVVKNLSLRQIRYPRILEIGCGTGNTTQLLLDKLRVKKLTCVDNSDDMISYARKRFARKDVNLVHQSGLEYLESRVANNSLDVVVTAQTLHNVPREMRELYYPEISRVLKVGGVFVNGDKFAHANPVQHYDALRAQIMNLGIVFRNVDRSDLAIKWIDHYLDDNQPHKILYESEFMEKCREFGMKPTIVHRYGMNAVGVAVKKYDV